MSHGDKQISRTPTPVSLHVNFDLNERHVFEAESPDSSASRYSSCAESELDRYSSANSTLGTPSLCGSVGTPHDCVSHYDSRSTRSLGPMDGNFRLDGSSLGDNFSRQLDADTGHTLSNLSYHLEGLSYNAVSSWGGLGPRGVVEWKCETGKKPVIDSEGGREDLGMLLTSVENVLMQGSVSSKCMNDEISNGVGFGRNQSLSSMEPQEEQEDISLTHEHSDGKDSESNYGLEDESRHKMYYSNNANDHYGKEADEGDTILMNTRIALGSADWEDFELEIADNTYDLYVLKESWEKETQCGGNHVTPATAYPSESCGCRIPHVQDRDSADGISEASGKFQGVSELPKFTRGSLTTDIEPSNFEELQFAVMDSSIQLKKVDSDNESIEYLEGCQFQNLFENTEPSMQSNMLAASQRADDSESSNVNENDSHTEELGYYAEKSKSPDFMLAQASPAKDIVEDAQSRSICDDKTFDPPLMCESKIHSGSLEVDASTNSVGLNSSEDNAFYGKVKNVGLNAFYDEVVLDMEEILLESSESSMSRVNPTSKFYECQLPSMLRDGGSTASTSGTVDTYPQNYTSSTIDDIKVVGTKQKRGDISLSERLVGVKEHCVYVIRVWDGEYQWEVEHRYRDFYTLYSQLKSLFFKQGWVLPSPWSAVEGESKKIFGNSSPDVVAGRSILIQDCLKSAVKFRYPSGPPRALIWFLSPPKTLWSSHHPDNAMDQPAVSEDNCSMGQTISLIVAIRPHKSMLQMLEAQHYTCGGCHKHFDCGKTPVLEFVQTLGWGKPRLCEYSGQLFCSSCHTHDTAVLPARVLHYWDFTEYQVSQLAKSYLDSITDQPMLCVSAVNPFLFSKVKVLFHVVSIRRKIGALLQYVRCPFRGTINRGLGSRRYLLDSNDFFALRDLIDLARGPFAVVPAVLETVLARIEEHITEQCLVCCDVGVPCGARQACDDTSSLIFPFQEEEVRRCVTCNLVFHKRCFERLDDCLCGARLKEADKASLSMSSMGLRPGSDNSLKLPIGMGFLSRLFPLGKQEKSAGQQEGDDNVILMGSLPGNSF